MPDEYLLTGVFIYRSTPEKSIISSNLFLISIFYIPRIAPFKYMFSIPVNSG
jgi:hypothetical protein